MSEMIDPMDAYFRGMVPERDALLLALEAEAETEDIPIVGPVVGQMLYILARFAKARQVLELGTATGYSAIYLARACRELGGRLTCIEADAGMAARAKANFETAGLADLVDILVQDAEKALADMTTPVDLIFMDIDKIVYSRVLADCTRLARPGSLLVADNVGFEDAKTFNAAIASHERWRCVHLQAMLPLHSPEKDALCLALRV